jgi:RNA polymerase sigma-70 factor (ECF subfamily)
VFPTTRWNLVLSARQGNEASRRAALETLLATYWRPVYVYLRRKGLPAEAAEDAVQGLFLRLLEQDALRRLDPARGRFRSYLLTALQHYLVNLHEHDSALKRGGRGGVVSLETLDVERDLPAAPPDPVRAFDREWALAVMERALARLEQEYREGRRKGSAAAMLRFFRLDEAPSYAQAAAECGMTPSQFKAALHRARERFREILREEVADTVEADSDGPDELRALFEALTA